MTTRQEVIAHYKKHPEVSVLVVGAGINGVGTFRDLALQGVDVLMIDKEDICSGSSAASSRQAHGGLRYLEHGEFRLVRESLAERNRLLRNAPHGIQLLPTTIPIFSWFSGLLNAPLKFLGMLERPSERGYAVVKLGMMLYDWFTRADRMTPTHRMLDRASALKKHPGLNPRIIGAATYYDCLIPRAERIALELTLDGEATSEVAHALNYCGIVAGDGDTVELRDGITGDLFTVRPKLLINASGAWIDLVNRKMKRATSLIGGTKGSHIVVDHPELLKILAGSVIYFENVDGRLGVFMPFFDKVIIGATDIRIDDPDSAVCDDEEIDYFLKFSQHVLPGIRVEYSQIVFRFSGVRPLPASDAKFVGLVSRSHSIHVTEPDTKLHFPIYSLVGGKWTTYRSFAEQVTDKALDFLGQSRRISTESLPIGGGKHYPSPPAEREHWLHKVQSTSGLEMERLTTLFERYGTRAELIARYIVAGIDQPLRGQNVYSRREIMFLAENEKVEHVDDVIIRRTLLGLLGQVTGDVLMQVTEAVGMALKWSQDRIQEEYQRTASILVTKHGASKEILKPTASDTLA